MSHLYISITIILYFALLLVMSYFSSKNDDSNEVFFRARREAPWYLVAFGMIGASLSGVTFISVPGWVDEQGFSYLQMVFGYIVGYYIIAHVLLPLYYRMNLTSIYRYLLDRYGEKAHRTGSILFLVARTAGASLRLFLVAGILQLLVFDQWKVPYAVTVTITILLIWIYTFRGGIKTIIWTDTLQTFFMLAALVVTIAGIASRMDLHLDGLVETIRSSPYSRIFHFDDFRDKNYFWKQFAAGVFIAVSMTGLDQGMMQKNLSVRTLRDSQKNMWWFSWMLLIVNLLFLSLGALLLLYADYQSIDLKSMGILGDKIFPYIAVNGGLGVFPAVLFILGLIAAAYSSADSSMTAITTSVSLDILEIDKKYPPARQKVLRKWVHAGISLVFILVLLLYKQVIKDQSIIHSIFTFAGYTYGPLLGLYAFGLFTRFKTRDTWIPLIVIIAPLCTYFVSVLPRKLGWKYEFGFELLLINAGITFAGLWLSGLGMRNEQ